MCLVASLTTVAIENVDDLVQRAGAARNYSGFAGRQTNDNPVMTLDIDTTQPIRSLARQRELIRAIVDAHASTQETDWVEWKTEADVGKKPWQARLARLVLGFANREPNAAGRWCGGCAYTVVGASPGRLDGAPVHDIAKLDAWLSAYIGAPPNAPEWSAAYVAVHEKTVLLITVEPPSWGNRIWTLQKDFPVERGETPMRAGAIFVRRKGRTELANPGDVAMLTQRACAGTRRLGLTLSPTSESRAIAVDLRASVVETWVQTKRLAMKAQAPPPPTEIDQNDPNALKLAALGAIAASLAETRSREAYQAEVDEYLEKATRALPAALVRGAVRHGLGRIDLRLVNQTDHNFSKVAVELDLDLPDVSAFFDEYEVDGPPMPHPTEPWGANRFGRGFASALRIPRIPSPIEYTQAIIPRGDIDNSHSTRIRFLPVDVRPGYSHRLDEFFLVVGPQHAGKTLKGSWAATATDVSGIIRGDIEIRVGPTMPDASQLLAAPSYAVDEDV